MDRKGHSNGVNRDRHSSGSRGRDRDRDRDHDRSKARPGRRSRSRSRERRRHHSPRAKEREKPRCCLSQCVSTSRPQQRLPRSFAYPNCVAGADSCRLLLCCALTCFDAVSVMALIERPMLTCYSGSAGGKRHLQKCVKPGTGSASFRNWIETFAQCSCTTSASRHLSGTFLSCSLVLARWWM